MSKSKIEPSFHIKAAQSRTTLIYHEDIEKIRDIDALGVYVYLLSFVFSTMPTNGQIMKHFDCSQKHLDKCLNYLRKIDLIN